MIEPKRLHKYGGGVGTIKLFRLKNALTVLLNSPYRLAKATAYVNDGDDPVIVLVALK